MPGALSTYAFINAKIRTRMGLLFDEDLLGRLERSESLGEFIEVLASTGYEAASAVYAATKDPNLAELALNDSEHAVYRELIGHLSGPPGQVVSALYLRFEIENLKSVLRLWFEEHVRKIANQAKSAYLPAEPWPAGIDGTALSRTGTLEELFDLFRNALGSDLKLPPPEEILKQGSIFAAEIALDRFYFSRLSQAVSRLTGRDRTVAERLIGFEADIENLRRIARLGTFYELSAERIRESLIEIPSARIDANSLAGTSIEEIVTDRFPEIAPLFSGKQRSVLARLDLVEAALEDATEVEIRKVLGGHPFTVGIILSYCMRKHREVRRIVKLLNEKRYGFDARDQPS